MSKTKQALGDFFKALTRSFELFFTGQGPPEMSPEEFYRGWRTIPFPEKIIWVSTYGVLGSILIFAIINLVW